MLNIIEKNAKRTKASYFKALFSRNEMIFGSAFLIIFAITFSIMYTTGLIPIEFLSSTNTSPTIIEKIQDNSLKQIGLGLDDRTAPAVVSNSPASNPIRIEATSISLNSTIDNPSTTDYRVLDNALLQGAVHYPGSGTVNQGNMFIFGHSTGYKIVNNKAFQVFNNIHSLNNGDSINVYTNNKEYVYKVVSVQLVDSREELVNFTDTDRMLTLSTCNSFGQKTDRYVVKAQFDHTIDI